MYFVNKSHTIFSKTAKNLREKILLKNPNVKTDLYELQVEAVVMSTSIVTTQLIERRERSRFGLSNSYSNYGARGGGRSISLPSANRTSDDRANSSIRTIDEFSSPRPGIQISTQSIVLQSDNESGYKSDVPIHHLRRASLTESHMNSHSYESSRHQETVQREAITSNNNNDDRLINGNYTKQMFQIVNNNDYGDRITSSRHYTAKPKVSFQPVVEEVRSTTIFDKHNETVGQKQRSEQRNHESYNDYRRRYTRRKVIAFVGATPFSVGDDFECIEADNDFSNLNREEVVAIIVGKRDLDAEQLYRFNNLQIVVSLNPLHSAQLSTNSRFRVESIAANEWINDAADTTLAMILNLFRRTSRSTDQRWVLGRKTITHCVLGIVGLGRIGLAVLDRARRFQLDIVFYDPILQQGMDVALGVKRAPTLRDLLEMSDCVTLHCPLNHTTRHTINSEMMYSMKRGCALIT
ncbi:unnamed protein product [Toxocara canis]|uniref:2-Hacid_dh_C domain-containing protein n=1 Tax=Toxocara canis TaxID=6265 RepID=A0A183V7Z7_TOXCA|nr:unnamed protein product [Toxocara canis]